MTHSPTPWELCTDCGDILDEEGIEIGTADIFNEYDGTFIITAVNNYQALVDALSGLLKELVPDMNTFEDDMRYAISNTGFSMLQERVTTAQEALAKATEGQE